MFFCSEKCNLCILLTAHIIYTKLIYRLNKRHKKYYKIIHSYKYEFMYLCSKTTTTYAQQTEKSLFYDIDLLAHAYRNLFMNILQIRQYDLNLHICAASHYRICNSISALCNRNALKSYITAYTFFRFFGKFMTKVTIFLQET